MSRIRRILAVTAGLMVTGVIAGGLSAVIGVAITAVIRGEWRAIVDLDVWGFSAMVGAVIGVVVAPVTSWLFLRHVPLGKLVTQTTIATALLGGIGFALHVNPFIAAPLGFIAAAARLAIVTPRGKPRGELPGDPPERLGP